LNDDLLDFDNTAALCMCMDLVVTIDSSLAPLAGALGHRTWVLLPQTPDFRWMRDREDSPWYPSIKLYRQTVAGIGAAYSTGSLQICTANSVNGRPRARVRSILGC